VSHDAGEHLGEISACGVFDRKGLGFLERSVKRADRHGCAWHHIVALFQFAGSYDHSRHLRQGVAPGVKGP